MRAPWRAQRWETKPRLVFGIALGIAALPARADAGLSVSISCEVLSQNERASVEARARADLAVKGLTDGWIELACGDGRARVDYAAPGGMPQHRSAPSAGDSKQLLEQLLALLDDVTSAPPEAGSSADEAEREASVVDPKVVSKITPSRESLPKLTPGPTPTPVTAPPGWRQGEIGVGVSSEFWASEVTAAVGPRLSFGVTLYPKLRARLAAAVLIASHRPEESDSRLFVLGAEAEWSGVEHANLVAGANLSQLVVDARPGWAPRSHSSLAPGLHARLELPFRFAGGVLAFGPEVVLRARAREIKVDERTILGVPAVGAGLLLDLRLGVPLE